MKVLAIVCAYNEADIIGWTVRHLKRQGCGVLVIDCQSTDDTQAVARQAGAMTERRRKGSRFSTSVRWTSMVGTPIAATASRRA